MRNKVIIPEGSGLDPRKHQRALEVLADAPLDILSVFQEPNEARFYSKLKLASTSPRGGINWSHLAFCLESPFYRLDFYGVLKPATGLPETFHEYLIYSEGRKVAEIFYDSRPEELPKIALSSGGPRNFSCTNHFIFVLEVPAEKLLGPDGNPLFPRS